MTAPVAFPFLTAYDPPGTSEGTLDPMGLYQIAEHLAVELVPSVRERMQRVRFLTAMAVGAKVTEDMDGGPPQRDAEPYLVWEWLVIESFIRESGDDPDIWGVPGVLVTRRAREGQGYLDARSYLKTPRIFGFHGVYKRLALRLGILDVHLAAGPNSNGLVDAWARGLPSGAGSAKELIARWRAAVRRSLAEKPPRTKGMDGTAWVELAQAFAPGAGKARERRYLQDLLHTADDRRLSALPAIWRLLEGGFTEEDLREDKLHARLAKAAPQYESLVRAIGAYEAFARGLQDAFDVLKAEAAAHDVQGFLVPQIASSEAFQRSVKGLSARFAAAHGALGEVRVANISLQNLFDQRFAAFAEQMDGGAVAAAVCAHHEAVQRAKSADGKRPWFDRIGPDRVYIRHAYRKGPTEIKPDRYVHGYRGWPIRSFYRDLR